MPPALNKSAAYSRWTSEETLKFYELKFKSEEKKSPELDKWLSLVKENDINGYCLGLLEKSDFHMWGFKDVGFILKVIQYRDLYVPKKKSDKDETKTYLDAHDWQIRAEGKGNEGYFLEWKEGSNVKKTGPIVKYDLNSNVVVTKSGEHYNIPDEVRSRKQNWTVVAGLVDEMRKVAGIEIMERPEVYMSMKLQVTNIDLRNEIFALIGELRLFWEDDDLLNSGTAIEIKDGKNNRDPKRVPVRFTRDDSIPVNTDKLFEQMAPGSFNMLEEEFFYNTQTKVVMLSYRFTVSVFESMEVHRFPYDRQLLQVYCLADFGDWNVVSKPKPNWKIPLRLHPHVHVTVAPTLLSQYMIVEPWVDIKYSTKGLSADPNAVFIGIRVQRYQLYFLFNVILPQFLITSLAIVSLKMGAAALQTRVFYVTVLLLTTVSYRNSISSQLPPVSYITFMDLYMFFNFMIYIALIIEAIIIFEQQETRPDYAKDIDETIITVGLIFWGVLHLIFIFCGYMGWLYLTWEAVLSDNLDGVETAQEMGSQTVELSDDPAENPIKRHATVKMSQIQAAKSGKAWTE
mmetsp:Transcript_2069/g.3245  ORF Transcript_2069/g.3245 Transcript_2069/m.3245 type:complete len:570 (+) Transcript_2069:79-1788(+)|eukprot:jgi/Bigna1/78763/fgenesh1_pg.57_\